MMTAVAPGSASGRARTSAWPRASSMLARRASVGACGSEDTDPKRNRRPRRRVARGWSVRPVVSNAAQPSRAKPGSMVTRVSGYRGILQLSGRRGPLQKPVDGVGGDEQLQRDVQPVVDVDDFVLLDAPGHAAEPLRQVDRPPDFAVTVVHCCCSFCDSSAFRSCMVRLSAPLALCGL